MANRTKMSRQERAKQFMPFAALKGYSEALRKKEKVVVPRAEVSEEYAEVLDRKLRKIKKKDIVTIIYFHNGEYLKKTGMVARIDETARILKIVNAKIGFEDIFDIKQE